MSFRPTLKTQLTINGDVYSFLEHPAARGMPYGQAGRRATVYQVGNGSDLQALKVFASAYRTSQTDTSALRIEPFANLPGLQVCSRTVLTCQNNPALINQFPELEFSVLMPWVAGQTWQEILQFRQSVTQEQSLCLAHCFATMLATLEQNNIAHCDISGANLLISGLRSKENKIEEILVDVEDLFAPELEKPNKLPGGSTGYAHKTTSIGVWRAAADRFAGAVLLAEMLGWCDERVRRIAFGEQYFEASELQETSERFQVLLSVLQERFDLQPDLWTRVWLSDTLDECPSMSEWAQVLETRLTDLKPAESNLPALLSDVRDSDEFVKEPESIANPEKIILPLTAGDYQKAMKAERSSLFKHPDGENRPAVVQMIKKKWLVLTTGISCLGIFILVSVAATILFLSIWAFNSKQNNSNVPPVGSQNSSPVDSESTPTQLLNAETVTPSPGVDFSVEFRTEKNKNYIYIVSPDYNPDHHYQFGPVAIGKIYVEPGKNFFVYYQNGLVYAAKIGEKNLYKIGNVENFKSVIEKSGDELIIIKANCSTIFISEKPGFGPGYKTFPLDSAYWCD